MSTLSSGMRRALTLTLVSLIAVATQHTQVPAVIDKEATDTTPLELKITAFTSAPCLNSSFEIHVEIINTSGADVVINKRSLERSLSSPSVAKVSQDDCDAEKFIEISCGGWDEDDLLTLVPGQSYQATHSFEAKSLFACESSYEIALDYQASGKADWIPAAMYRGRVTSNKLRIETFACN